MKPRICEDSRMRTLVVLAISLAFFFGCKRHEPNALAETAQACTSSDLGCPRAILYVHDLAASQRYYHDQLGFKLDWTDGDPPEFGAVSRGDTQLFMCQRCQGHAGSWLWVFSPDVDRLYGELVKRGAIIKSPPANMPWHVREMQVADPDGNVLRIGSPVH
jgi:catechol 2,3-dioxygenase-like lactoylglutathione lyase family enzyme